MRHIRSLLAVVALLLPIGAAGIGAAQPASATQGFVFAGACTVNATATFSAGLVKATGLGTCVVDNNIVTMDFSTTAFPIGPSSCAAAVATGGGSFDLGAPIGVADSPTTEQVVFAGGTATIVFEYNTFQLTAVATMAIAPGDAAGCLLGGSVAHYTGAVVLQDPSVPSQ